jgi:hypothetical protein
MTSRYVEFVIDGPKGWDLGFVRGFLHGRGMDGRVIDAEKEGFDCAPLREHLKEMLHPDSDTAHLLVPEDLTSEVEEAVQASGGAGFPMVIRHRRPVHGARFTFSVHLYSREVGKKVLSLFTQLPPQVTLNMTKEFEERVDPAARGVELYAPTHDYELKGEGTLEGELEPVLSIYRACRDEEIIHQSEAHLIPG